MRGYILILFICCLVLSSCAQTPADDAHQQSLPVDAAVAEVDQKPRADDWFDPKPIPTDELDYPVVEGSMVEVAVFNEADADATFAFSLEGQDDLVVKIPPHQESSELLSVSENLVVDVVVGEYSASTLLTSSGLRVVFDPSRTPALTVTSVVSSS